MKIVLDTNFIVTCIKQKIDFADVAEQIISENIEWIVPQEVLNELGNLKDRDGMKREDKVAAEFAFTLLQSINPQIIELEPNQPNVDIAIVNFIFDTDMVLATLDKDLKSRVSNRILSIRGKDFLELV